MTRDADTIADVRKPIDQVLFGSSIGGPTFSSLPA